MKIVLVAGTRPNFVKAAPVLAALRARGHETVLVHTGQHYDDAMSGAFFRDLALPPPDVHLAPAMGADAASPARRLSRVLEGFEPIVLEARPDWVVVLGDVDSTLACALAAARLRGETGGRIAHVEAGLRCRERDMPEEINRRLTDHLADLLLAPSADAEANLLAEGIEPGRIVLAGNVMVDTLLARLPDARARDLPARLGLERGGYAVATLHRQANTDDPARLAALLGALDALAARIPVVLPLHPRTRGRIASFGLAALTGRLRAVEPLGYLDMLSLTDGAAVALTDSGGLQEETTALGVPCVTLRESTERPVTIAEGTNRLAPWPPTVEGVRESAEAALASGRRAAGETTIPGWDGHAAPRMVAAMEART